MSKQDVIDYVMETPYNTNRAVLEGLVDTAVEESQVQADWDQNDETAKDYIKNRIGGYYNTTATADSGTLTTTSFLILLKKQVLRVMELMLKLFIQLYKT